MAYLKLRGLKSKGVKETDFPAQFEVIIDRETHSLWIDADGDGFTIMFPGDYWRLRMMLSLRAPFGGTLSLDLRRRFGDRVEFGCFQFVIPPVEFRLVRNGRPLQEWQPANTEMYDLQHAPRVAQWARDNHWFINDLDHRHDVRTCGLLSQDVKMETRGLGFDFLLLVWLRDGTWHSLRLTEIPYPTP